MSPPVLIRAIPVDAMLPFPGPRLSHPTRGHTAGLGSHPAAAASDAGSSSRTLRTKPTSQSVCVRMPLLKYEKYGEAKEDILRET